GAVVQAQGRCLGGRTLTACGGRRAQAADLRLAGLTSRPRVRARKRPVCDAGSRAISSGVPWPMIVPPRWPPSGPRSTTQSAVLITSRLCSITTTVLPSSRSLCSTASRCSMSWKCRPVVGSGGGPGRGRAVQVVAGGLGRGGAPGGGLRGAGGFVRGSRVRAATDVVVARARAGAQGGGAEATCSDKRLQKPDVKAIQSG